MFWIIRQNMNRFETESIDLCYWVFWAVFHPQSNPLWFSSEKFLLGLFFIIVVHCCFYHSFALFTERKASLTLLVETESLTSDEIQSVFDFSDNYTIPYKQTETKRIALVLYNSDGRDQSVEEANYMNGKLRMAGFTALIKKWSNAMQLPEILHYLHPVQDRLSLLFVCIMSHGRAGMIVGSNSTKMPITDILTVLESNIPIHIPMVSRWDFSVLSMDVAEVCA